MTHLSRVLTLCTVGALLTPGASRALTITQPAAHAIITASATDAVAESSDNQGPDSLYRLARRALSDGDYRKAADLFARVARGNPRQSLAADALYFRAFALYRLDNTRDLEVARDVLTELKTRFPDVAKRGDAAALSLRVCGALARQGDSDCAERVATTASGGNSRSVGGGASRSSSSGTSAGRPVEARAQVSQQGRSCPAEDDEDDERVMALNALLSMNADQAMPILEGVLARRDACSAGLRKKAVFLVSQKQTNRSVDLLLKAAREDPDTEVREAAVFWLSQTGDARAVDILNDLLSGETNDFDVRKKALFALSQIRGERSSQILRTLAAREGANLELREQAIFWLGQQGSENTSLLRSLYAQVRQNELKEKIIFSIAQSGGTANRGWLRDLVRAQNEDTDRRKNALFWLGQTNGVTLDELSSLYTQLSEKELKEQMIFVFSQRNEKAAVDWLMSVAKNDTDRELRKKAIFWLGQSPDPRVPKFLAELISR